MTDRLIERYPTGRTRAIPLDMDEVTIGRDPANTVVVPSAFVSRVHAVIRRQGDAYLLADASKNGTLRNGRVIAGAPALQHGDTIRFPGVDEYELVCDFTDRTLTWWASPPDPSAIRIDVHTGEVWVRGNAVHCTPHEFAALAYFVAHPGALVTKAELAAVIWPDLSPISRPANDFAALLKRIRAKIEVDPRRPRYLVTVSRRGYRFYPHADGELAPSVPPL